MFEALRAGFSGRNIAIGAGIAAFGVGYYFGPAIAECVNPKGVCTTSGYFGWSDTTCKVPETFCQTAIDSTMDAINRFDLTGTIEFGGTVLRKSYSAVSEYGPKVCWAAISGLGIVLTGAAKIVEAAWNVGSSAVSLCQKNGLSSTTVSFMKTIGMKLLRVGAAVGVGLGAATMWARHTQRRIVITIN